MIQTTCRLMRLTEGYKIQHILKFPYYISYYIMVIKSKHRSRTGKVKKYKVKIDNKPFKRYLKSIRWGI